MPGLAGGAVKLKFERDYHGSVGGSRASDRLPAGGSRASNRLPETYQGQVVREVGSGVRTV